MYQTNKCDQLCCFPVVSQTQISGIKVTLLVRPCDCRCQGESPESRKRADGGLKSSKSVFCEFPFPIEGDSHTTDIPESLCYNRDEHSLIAFLFSVTECDKNQHNRNALTLQNHLPLINCLLRLNRAFSNLSAE